MNPQLPKACPSENTLLDRAMGNRVGRLALDIDAHLDACDTCRAAVADAARDHGGRSKPFLEMATFSAGDVIGGRYVAVRRIGIGGMGEVYEVHDRYLDEVVALKTLAPTIADDSSAIARLSAEVRLARRVTHENVCRTYDLGFHQRGTEQIAFLTMELIRGVTLRQRIAKDGPFESDQAQLLVEQMARGLGHAHAAGIVHRDFKSDNVMLVPANDRTPERAVVMDFGLARAAFVAEAQALTPDSHAVLGTLDYMSPEQVQGSAATALSDVYALGVVMYEMLTGSLPFEGESPLARALARVTSEPALLRAKLPDADPQCEAVIARCLRFDERDRFPTMDALRRALGTMAVPVARGPRRAAGVVAVLLALGSAVMGYVVGSSRAPAGTAIEVPAVTAVLRAPAPPTSDAPIIRAPVAGASAQLAEHRVRSGVVGTLRARAPRATKGGEAAEAPVTATSALPPLLSRPRPPEGSVTTGPPGPSLSPGPARDALLDPFAGAGAAEPATGASAGGSLQ